jgi:hypothetical protein
VICNKRIGQVLQQQTDYSRGGILNIGSQGPADLAVKRQKQQEYTAGLNSQLAQKQRAAAPAGYGGALPSRGADAYSAPPSSAAAPVLDENWVIGPLGVPVRRTLEVGNRGVQKAFNLGQMASPPRGAAMAPVIANRPYGSNMAEPMTSAPAPYGSLAGYSHPMDGAIRNTAMFGQPQQPQPAYYPSAGAGSGDDDYYRDQYLNPPAVVQPVAGIVRGAAPMDLQAERDAKMKQQKVSGEKFIYGFHPLHAVICNAILVGASESA